MELPKHLPSANGVAKSADAMDLYYLRIDSDDFANGSIKKGLAYHT